MARVIRSSAATLAVSYVLLGVAALVLFAAPLIYAWQSTIDDFLVDILKDDSQRMTQVFQLRGPAGLKQFIDARLGLQIAGERILLLTDAQMRPLAGNLRAWPHGIPRKPGSYTLPVNLEGRVIPLTLVRTTLPGGYSLLVGRNVQRYQPLEHRFFLGLAAALAVISITGLIGGILVRRALLSRIQSIRQTVSAIMRGDLGHRLPTRASGDELDTLAQTINRMLEQIEQLVHGISDVSNSIAHDLRTPLAELRSRLEELSLTRPGPAETFAEIEAAVADVDSVIRIFNALLRLAEIDTGMRRAEFVETDVGDLAAKAVEFYLPAAELKELTLACRESGPVRVLGDRLLLAQAINNLVDNAVKYTAAGGRVSVEAVRRADGGVGIVVADNGPGIPDAEKPMVARRFYRGDASRATPGVGLGLSLVEAIARLHEGGLELSDNQPGLRAELRLGASLTAPARSPARAVAAALG